jgi:hypothetical protein
MLVIKLNIQKLSIYSILVIGLISIPSLLETVQAQITMTNTTSSSAQNQTAQGANQTAQAAQNQTAQTAQAAQNQTAQTAQAAQNQTAQGANQTMSKETQAFMALDIAEIKDNLMDSKNALANNDTEEALTTITDLENTLLVLQPKPSFVDNIQKIKDSISKKDLNKALDDLNKVETDVLKAENEVFKAQLANPQLKVAQQDNGDADEDGDEEDGDGGGDEEDGDGGGDGEE